jgi:predicted DsbA family dithiol-disulfide isomerase
MMERLMRGYFTENRPLGDVETLIQLGTDVGLDPSATRAMVESGKYATEVNDDIEHATQLGIRGVPFFVVDRRHGVSGAQSSDILLDLLERAWEASHPGTRPGAREGATIRGSDECTVVPTRLEAT